MDQKSKELLKKEMWTWIGSGCGAAFWVLSTLIKREKFVDTSNVPDFVNEWLIKHDYMLIKLSDWGHNTLISMGCFFCGVILLYFLSSFIIKSNGVEGFKGFFRGVFIWGFILAVILLKCIGF